MNSRSVGTTPDQSSAATVDMTAPSKRRQSHDTVLVLDFGGQYALLIARRIRECNVYSELVPHTITAEEAGAHNVKGVVLSGGPASVFESDAPRIPQWILESDLPVLGICYGMQALTHQLGGEVAPGAHREYGPADLHITRATGMGDALFQGLSKDIPVWMSHGDRINATPSNFATIATTDNSPIAAMGDKAGRIGLQFHPEVAHTPGGTQIIRNFLLNVCHAEPTWTATSFIDQSIETLRSTIGNGRVICGLSGGVDSSVTAVLLDRAVGAQLTCIFVDNGLLRRGEADWVVETFGNRLGMALRKADSSERFLARLERVTDPEKKRQIIGDEFMRTFNDEALAVDGVRFLAQGTLYPDVIESGGTGSKTAARIKTHHNVGFHRDLLMFDLVEPLRLLFKDEVREVGASLDLPEDLLWRHPFPGPGLAVRILGAVTRERLDRLRAADAIFEDEIRSAGLYRDLWQSFATLLDSRSVGVMGDFRTYGEIVALRAVTSQDAMTADWARLPHDLLARTSNRIVNEVEGVNRVLYDITSKPPATIELE